MASNQQRGKEALSHLEKEIAARDRKQKQRPWVTAAASIAVIAALGGGIYFLANQSEDDVTASGESSSEATSAAETSEFDASKYEAVSATRATALPATVSCTYTEGDQKDHFKGLPPADNVSTQGTVNIKLDTSAGAIGMSLDRSVSPCTVNAMEFLAKDGYFDNTVCHRLTTSDGLKVLQCGDPSGTGSGGPGFQFPNEFPTDEALENVDTSQLNIPDGASDDEKKQYESSMLQSDPKRYERGTIAMANSGIDTNGSQFFLNYGDSILPPLYTYFGSIDEEGLSTLDKIAEKGVEGGSTDGAPAEEVKINSASVV